MGFKQEMRREISRLNNEIVNLTERVSPTVESGFVTQNTPQPDMQGAIQTVIRWFELTDTSATPMVGTMQRFDPNAGPAAWITHNLVDVNVYPHPELTHDDYEDDTKITCVFVGGRWWGVTGVTGGGTQVHKAFMKAAATSGTHDICFLDTDTTGDEINVDFSIVGGSNLNEAIGRLVDGSLVFVVLFGNDWFCIGSPFQGSEDCVCETPA